MGPAWREGQQCSARPRMGEWGMNIDAEGNNRAIIAEDTRAGDNRAEDEI